MKISKLGRIDSTMISYFLPHLWKKCICSNFKIEQDTEANKGFKKDSLGQFYQRSLGSFYASSLTQILLAHGVEPKIWAYFLAMRISKVGRIFVGETDQRRCRQRMTTRAFALYAIRLVKLTPCVFQNRSRDLFPLLGDFDWHYIFLRSLRKKRTISGMKFTKVCKILLIFRCILEPFY